MADQRISDLTTHTLPIAGDLLPIVDVTAGVTKKITLGALGAAVGGVVAVITATMVGDLSIGYPGGIRLMLYLDPNGANRSVDFPQTPTPYPTGFEVCMVNRGPYTITMDAVGIAVVVPPGPTQRISWDGTSWNP